MKEKQEEEMLFMDKCFCVNACQSCYNVLILGDMKNVDNETNQYKEKWKYQVVAKKIHQEVQLKLWKINNDKSTAEINEKRKEISKLNQRMVMLKEELTCVKEKLHKTYNVHIFRADKREPLSKKEM